MATNTTRWRGNLLNPDLKGPLIMPGNFAKGDTAAIKAGELIELTGNTNTEWVPMDSDFAGAHNVAIAAVEIAAGDKAGKYEIIVPRPGDQFEFELATASNPSLGDSLYWSTSEKVATSGSNILGRVVGWNHYPYPQHHLSKGEIVDEGTTIGTVPKVLMGINPDASYWGALYPQT